MPRQTVPQQTFSDKGQVPAAATPAATSSGVSLPAVPVFQLAYNGKKKIAEVPDLVEDLEAMGFLTDDRQRGLLGQILAMNKNFELSDIIPILSGEKGLGPDTAPSLESKVKKQKPGESDEEIEAHLKSEIIQWAESRVGK